MADQLPQPNVVPNVAKKLKSRKHTQAVYYDLQAKVLHLLTKGDVVRVLPLPGQSKWLMAQVEDHVVVRSHKIHTENGRVYRRNHSHLYKVPED